MSSQELLAEYTMDLPELRKLTKRFDESEYIFKCLHKQRKSPRVVISKEFHTSRGNHYIGILNYFKSGSNKNYGWNWNSVHLGLMNTYKGANAIAFFEDSNQALRFTPHFFRRYKERFLQIADWKTRNRLNAAKSIVDIISIYVERNSSIAWIETKSIFRDKVHIFGPVNDGVVLIQYDKSNNILQANTFVTEDMLDAKQLEMVDYARTYFSLTKEERQKFQLPDFIYNDKYNLK
jgi:hypothetical protein